MHNVPEYRLTASSGKDRTATQRCGRTTDKGCSTSRIYSLISRHNQTKRELRKCVEDSYCPSGYLIFWNLDYCNLYSHSQRTFPGELVDFQKPINQDVAVAHLRWAGEFICSAPRFQGVMTALTA